MSNYSSLFRVLSPSRVQTKFEENSLPARYIVEMSLFFVVLEHPLPNPSLVDIAEVNIVNGKPVNKEDLTTTHLKDMIWDAIKSSEDDTNKAHRLTLWKIEDLREDTTKWQELTTLVKSYTETKIEELGGKKLSSTKKFIVSFPDVPEDRVHILVQPSSPATTGKRKMVEDEDEDKEDEYPVKKEKLYLQKQDKEKFRNLVNSLPKIDTQAKLFKIPRLPGDNEDADIYNRECYQYLCNFILEDTNFKRYLITGNPGVGKTFFGRLMLIELLKKDKTVLLDYETFTVRIKPSGEITYVENKTLFRQMAEQQNVWCIIDGKRDQVGHDFSNGKLIMVSSPKKAIVGDFAKQWCRKLYMPTWSENELEECWDNLYRESGKFTLKSVKDKFKLCGGIARWIFSDESLLDIKSVIRQALTSVEPKMLCNQAKDFSGDEYTHKLIHINTNLKRTDEAEPYTESFCFFASDYVAKECLKKLKNDYKEHLRTFIEGARDIPEMGSLRGQLFELVSHEILRQGGVFPVRKLTDDGKLGPETTITLESLEEISFDNVSDIEENIGQNQKMYYRPTSKIFETIDSYVHHNKLFQVTVAKSHGIKQEGLREIKGILELSRRINFYFVLPKDVFATYKKKQKYENKGEGLRIDSWITNNIDQYALCLDFNQYSF